MLSAIVKEHQNKQAARKERQGNSQSLVYVNGLGRIVESCANSNVDLTEQKRKDAVQAASNLTQALVDHLNVG